MRAAEGFPVSKRLSQAMELISGYEGADVAELKRIFLKDGRPYAPGETLRQPELVALMQGIVDAENQREGFYDGEVGAKIVAALKQHGGVMDIGRLQRQGRAVRRRAADAYRDCDVYEQALPSQGIILLMALNIVEQFPVADWGVGSADAMHVLVEATKLAFADSRRYCGRPEGGRRAGRAPAVEGARQAAGGRNRHEAGQALRGRRPAQRHDGARGRRRGLRRCLHPERVLELGQPLRRTGHGHPDEQPPARASAPTPSAANVLAPGKRTVHTLNTFMMLRDGALVVGGGTPGMDFQVQNNLQTVVGVRDWGLDLQSALDMPRWVSLHDGTLALEGRFNAALQADLAPRGHALHVLPAWDSHLARSQVLASTSEGGWAFASDLRGEGIALAQ